VIVDVISNISPIPYMTTQNKRQLENTVKESKTREEFYR